jgi:hypothetical protein
MRGPPLSITHSRAGRAGRRQRRAKNSKVPKSSLRIKWAGVGRGLRRYGRSTSVDARPHSRDSAALPRRGSQTGKRVGFACPRASIALTVAGCLLSDSVPQRSRIIHAAADLYKFFCRFERVCHAPTNRLLVGDGIPHQELEIRVIEVRSGGKRLAADRVESIGRVTAATKPTSVRGREIIACEPWKSTLSIALLAAEAIAETVFLGNIVMFFCL